MMARGDYRELCQMLTYSEMRSSTFEIIIVGTFLINC